MPKEIIAIKVPNTIVYRFIGRLIYIKGNSNTYTKQLVQQIEQKGGIVIFGNGWARCNIFGDNTNIKLGKWSVDFEANLVTNTETKVIDVASDDVIEKVLCDFFKQTLEVSEFKCEVRDI